MSRTVFIALIVILVILVIIIPIWRAARLARKRSMISELIALESAMEDFASYSWDLTGAEKERALAEYRKMEIHAMKIREQL